MQAQYVLRCTRHAQIAPKRPQVQYDLLRSHSKPLLLPSLYRPPQHNTYATTAVTSDRDLVNPLATTRPPELKTPTRGQENIFVYLYSLARAYGGFYKTGVKAIFANRKEAEALKRRLEKDTGVQASISNNALVEAAVTGKHITRSEYQLLRRNAHDMRRVPVFGVLVLVLGEWLPLLVPFMPYLPPLTCRIPGQIRSMREKTEARRRWAFRRGTPEPGNIRTNSSVATTDLNHTQQLVASLKQEQLYHLSCALNLHGQIWETLQLPPPSFMLRARVAKHLSYIIVDDKLLSKAAGVRTLVSDELLIAAEERGIDILGPDQSKIQEQMTMWIKSQQKDQYSGKALLYLLFHRPNVWK